MAVDVEKAKAELNKLKDELKLKLHLAKKEAQDGWQSMEPNIKKVEALLDEAANKAGDVSERVRLEASLALGELKGSWPGVEKAVDQVVDDVKKAANDETLSEVAKRTADEVKSSINEIRKKLGI